MTELNILDPQIAARIINDIESDQMQFRRKYEYKQWVCYSGRLKDYVRSAIEGMFPKDSQWMDSSDINIGQKVVDKLSKAYKESPARKVSESKTQNEALNEIYSEGGFNEAFDLFDHRVNLHKYSALWVVQRPNDDGTLGPIELDVVPSFAFFPIIDNDSGKLIGMCLNYPGTDITHQLESNDLDSTSKLGMGTRVMGADGYDQLIAENPADSNVDGNTFVMWTDTQHAVWKVDKNKNIDGKIQTQLNYIRINEDETKDGVNDLGIIPFAYFSMEGGIELPVRSPLTEQSVSYNVDWSALRAAAVRNIGTSILEHPEGMKVQDMTTGLSTTLKIPQPSNIDKRAAVFRYENPDSDLSGQLSVYASNLQQIFGQYGITAKEGISAENVDTFTSGLDRMLANADVTDHLDKMQIKYQNVEKRVFSIVRAYQERNGKRVFNDDDKLMIIYPKPKIQISDKEMLDNIKLMRDLRLMSRKKALMVLDPNLTPEQAQQLIDEIDKDFQDDTKKVTSLFSRKNNGQEPEGDLPPDDSEDDQGEPGGDS